MKIPVVDVGIHLAITSEWDNIKWRPLTDCKSIRDSSGYFYPMSWPNKNYPGQSLKEVKWELNDIEQEFRAQIELGIEKYSTYQSYIGSHGLYRTGR